MSVDPYVLLGLAVVLLLLAAYVVLLGVGVVVSLAGTVLQVTKAHQTEGDAPTLPNGGVIPTMNRAQRRRSARGTARGRMRLVR